MTKASSSSTAAAAWACLAQWRHTTPEQYPTNFAGAKPATRTPGTRLAQRLVNATMCGHRETWYVWSRPLDGLLLPLDSADGAYAWQTSDVRLPARRARRAARAAAAVAAASGLRKHRLVLWVASDLRPADGAPDQLLLWLAGCRVRRVLCHGARSASAPSAVAAASSGLRKHRLVLWVATDLRPADGAPDQLLLWLAGCCVR